MNRQFKELALQAGYPDYMTYGQDLVLERFAELIVRECARIASNADLEDVEGGDSSVLCAAAEQIEQHFGVDK